MKYKIGWMQNGYSFLRWVVLQYNCMILCGNITANTDMVASMIVSNGSFSFVI